MGKLFEVDAVVVGSYKFLYRQQVETLLRRTLFEVDATLRDRLSGLPTEKLHLLVESSLSRMQNLKKSYGMKNTNVPRLKRTHSAPSLSHRLPQMIARSKNLAKQAITEFTRQIAPHYETEERFLVR